jgi:two-component system CitB family sensor kinase
MPRLGRTLASRILFAVLGIIALTMALGLALFTRVTSRATDQQAIEQARSIAVSLGQVPQVASAVQDGDPDHTLRRLGEEVRRASTRR